MRAISADHAPPVTNTLAQRISLGSGAAALFIGAMVLVGWSTGSERLISIDIRFVAMLPATAIGMIACATAILLLGRPTERRVRAASALGAGVLALGSVAFISRQMGKDLVGLGALFHDQLAAYPYRPIGVFATNSSIAFMCTGAALLLISSGRSEWRRAARVLASMSLTIALVALLGHLYGAPALYAIDRFAGMALVTAIAFATVQIGILFLRPMDGAIAFLTQGDLAGQLMRRLIPLTVLVPIVLGAALNTARREQLLSRETGFALFAALLCVWIVAVLLHNAAFIRRADEARNRLLEREQQLRGMAEAASKTKSDFLGVMSHELRTPLNAIIGYVDLLEGGIAGDVPESHRQPLARIRASATHLARTVEDILTLTRLEAGGSPLHVEDISLARVLEEVSGILEPLARARGLAFQCACATNIQVRADAHRLRQILINLGGNAIKFTPAGGVTITAEPHGTVARVIVADTGIGIDRQDLERIFEVFWQVEGALTRSFDGAGLGLAVSRRLARQLGGDICVESEPGKGSIFTLTVPVAAAATASAQPAQVIAS